MSTFVRVKNLSRRRLRFGGQNGVLPVTLQAASPTGTGASALVDVDDPQTRRDLYRNVGSWAHSPDILVSRVAFTGGTDTAGGVFSWANPEGLNIIVDRVVLDVTTIASAACTISVGVAANATTLNSGLINGQDVNAAIGVFTSTACQKQTATQFVTASKATGNSTGLVGVAYIYYTLAPAAS